MKKSFLMLGVAAMALASCTQNEVVEYADSRAIQFDTFVNNNTRAVTEVTGLTNFYVFGEFGSDTNYGQTVYANELNTTTHYWVASRSYLFGAYADGEGGKIDNATFNAAEKTLTFPDYTPKDTKDLVVATAVHTTDADVTNESAVDLTFNHMLSQVKFTFKTTDADAYTLKISDLQIEGAVTTATGTYKDENSTISWDPSNGQPSGTYQYAEIADVAVAAHDYTASDVKLVIPQSGTNSLKVTFKATISGPDFKDKSSTFTATLGYTAGAVAGTADNTWTPGFVYNYIATINGDQIDPTLEDQKIEFTTQVTSWQNAADTTHDGLVGTPVPGE